MAIKAVTLVDDIGNDILTITLEGTLAEADTANKQNLVAAVHDVLTRLGADRIPGDRLRYITEEDI